MSINEHQDQAIRDILASLDGYQLESDVSEGKVLVSSSDSTDDFLQSKITAGDNITITKSTCGGAETLTISAADQTTPVEQQSDEKVKTSATDNTSDYLQNKIEAGSNITITKKTCGGSEVLQISAEDQQGGQGNQGGADEKVKVSSSDGTAGYLGSKISAGTNVSLTTETLGGSQTIRIDVQSQNIADAEADIDELQSQVAQHSGSISTLQSDLSDFVDASVVSMDGYQNQIDQLGGSLDTLEDWVSGFVEVVTEDLDSYQAQIDQVGGSLDELEGWVSGFVEVATADMDGYQNQIDQLGGSLDTLEGWTSSFFEVVTADLDSYQAQIDQIGGTVETLRYDYSTAIDVITADLDSYQAQIDQLDNEVDQLGGSVETLDDLLANAIEEITGDLDGYQNQIDQLGGSVETLNDLLGDAIEEITGELDSYQAQIDQIGGSLETLREDHSNWVEVASNEMDGYQNQLDQHAGSIATLQGNLGISIENITTACDGYTAEIFGLDAYGDGYRGLVPPSAFSGIKYLRDDATWQRVIPQRYSFTDVEYVQIEHGLDYYPIVQLVDSIGRYFIPVNVIHYSTSIFKVTFIESFTGTIIYF